MDINKIAVKLSNQIEMNIKLNDPNEPNDPEEVSDLDENLNETYTGGHGWDSTVPEGWTDDNELASKVKKPVLNWNGLRPFVGAVEQYKKILNEELEKATKKLKLHSEMQFEFVRLPLFSQIDVQCKDQNDDDHIKTYTFHEVHYGPLVRVYIPENVRPKDRKWFGFFARQNAIWLDVNAQGKQPGGDGTGKDGTACSPFRDAQVALLKQGFYLLDSSNFEYDKERDRFWYKIQIAVYREPPKNGPFRIPHGYGFIPYLGPAPKITESIDH